MAHIKPVYTWVFLLVVIACHDILFTEGRQLKSTKKQEIHPIKDEGNLGKHSCRTISSHKTPTRKERNVQVTFADNRQIVENSVVRTREIFPSPPTQSLGFSAVAKPIDDFPPTTPGNSPGIGHSYAEHNVEIQPKGAGNGPGVHHSTAGNINDLPPTGPGHSPGIGHSFQNKKAEPNA